MKSITASPQQIAQFQADGYTVFPHFFKPNELKALVLELERFKREGLGRNVVTEGGLARATRQRRRGLDNP